MVGGWMTDGGRTCAPACEESSKGKDLCWISAEEPLTCRGTIGELATDEEGKLG